MEWPALNGAVIERIDAARLVGERPRSAGCNARLGEHGRRVTLDLVRIRAGGLDGFGRARLEPAQARDWLGQPLSGVFDARRLVEPAFRSLEFPLLDWLGRRLGRPVAQLVAARRAAGDPAPTAPTTPGAPSPASPLHVPCYDTSLYFDDLHLADDRAAVGLLQDEAAEGLARGHRHFKIKIGRGARHMPLEAGLRRDIAVVQGVRERVGSDGLVMVDANNGYNLNLTKQFLAATREADLHWLEEPFHEDRVLYQDLKEWLGEQGMATQIADGEGQASPSLLDWAQAGLIDLVQYDLIGYGFCRWLELGEQLAAHGVRAAPHNYGSLYGNYAACHVAPGIAGFALAEWDEAQAPGLDASAYRIQAGCVVVPDRPGFGLELDVAYFERLVAASGWSLGA